jgi:hypothetical protein
MVGAALSGVRWTESWVDDASGSDVRCTVGLVAGGFEAGVDSTGALADSTGAAISAIRCTGVPGSDVTGAGERCTVASTDDGAEIEGAVGSTGARSEMPGAALSIVRCTGASASDGRAASSVRWRDGAEGSAVPLGVAKDEVLSTAR